MIRTLLILYASLGTALSATSYQYVKFIHKNEQPHNSYKQILHTNKQIHGVVRPTRSYDFPLEFLGDSDDFWPDTIFLPPGENLVDITFGNGQTHFTPDFSNGLDYPDPLLLTGHAAKRAVSYLYGKGELFFHNIPHARSILKLQNERIENDLAPNRLGSLNARSPFYRNDQKNYHYSRY